MSKNKMKLTTETITALPKIILHEHIDCSPELLSVLWFWDEIGFDKANTPFPADVLEPWQQARRMSRIKGLSPQEVEELHELEALAVRRLQVFLHQLGSSSLKDYVICINNILLPVMQTERALKQITSERIKAAVADGIIAIELRFAPQLHRQQGLTYEQVMEAVIAGLQDSPIPVKLILCALRHEDKDHPEIGEKLVDLCIAYKQHVGAFDLAADEHGFPGVLPNWKKAAKRASANGIKLTIHLGETDEITERDLSDLRDLGITRVGHCIRCGSRGPATSFVREECVSSNIVTGQVKDVESHPINQQYLAGDEVTINTDGTAIINTSASREYMKLNEVFGWGKKEFLKCNLAALKASSFDDIVKSQLLDKLMVGYQTPV